MSKTTMGVGIFPLRNTAKEFVGLLGIPKNESDEGPNIANAVLLDGTDAEVGKAIRDFFAEPAQEG